MTRPCRLIDVDYSCANALRYIGQQDLFTRFIFDT